MPGCMVAGCAVAEGTSRRPAEGREDAVAEAGGRIGPSGVARIMGDFGTAGWVSVGLTHKLDLSR